MTRRQFVTGGIATAGALALPGCTFTTNSFSRRIPDEALQKIGELDPNGITTFAFTPSNGWVVATVNGPYFARGIPDECYQKLGEFVNGGALVYCIAFPPAGGNSWVITTNQGIFARGIPDECYQMMLTFLGQGHQILHVAFPPSGGNSWVIVTDGPFFARGIDDECYQMMRNLVAGGRTLGRVDFAWNNGGWVVVAQDEFFARRIDDECYQKMRSFAAGGWLITNLAFSPVDNGWSIYSLGTGGPMPTDLVRQFENQLPDGSGGTTDIWSRMAAHNVPGCTVAVVQNDQLAWATGYGYLEKGAIGASHPESRFQAASVSKPFAAMGVMNLLEDKFMSVTDDIRPKLGWTLPKRACLTLTKTPTIDLILQHMGGIIGRGTTAPASQCSGFDGSGGGYAGYPEGQTLPTLLDILNGTNTNSPRIELTTDPGSVFAYSGPGFVLFQKMIEQVSGQSFASYMQTYILQELAMTNSMYTTTVPQAWIDAKQIAAGHTTQGDVIPGKRNRYPELAAAGLYTTVEDLAKMIIFMNQKWKNIFAAGPINQASVQKLLSGRAFFVNGNSLDPGFNYSHGGSNYGFQCLFVGMPNRSAGYAIMTNGDDDGVVRDAEQALKSVYGW